MEEDQGRRLGVFVGQQGEDVFRVQAIEKSKGCGGMAEGRIVFRRLPPVFNLALPRLGKRGQSPYAGTARSVLGTNGDSPLSVPLR